MRDGFGTMLSSFRNGNITRSSAPHSNYADNNRARSTRSHTALVPRPPAGAPTSTSRHVTSQRPYTVAPHVDHSHDVQSVTGSGSGGYTRMVTSFSYNVKNPSTQRTERGSLPTAHPRQGLVNNGRYTLYKTASGGKLTASGAGPDHLQHRSLPGSRTQHIVEDHSRVINSAPHHQKAASQPSLPKINNLVNGKYSNEQPSYDRARNATKFTHGAAGMSTRDHDAHTLTSQKFASSWANARVDHMARDTSREKTEAAVSPREEQAAEKPPGTKGSKDYPKPWLMTKSKPAPSERHNDSTADTSKGSIQAPADSDNNTTVSENQENKDSKKTLTRKVTLPPRRERTRMRIQRAKSEAMLDGKLLAEDNSQQAAKDKGPNRRYSNVDAANVYYANAAAAIPPLPTRRNSRKDLKTDDGATKETNPDGVIPEEEEEGEDVLEEIPNSKPKEYILNRRESLMYVNIRSVYDKGTEKYRETREKRFYRRVEDLQKEKWKQEQAEYQQRKLREKQTKRRQSQQLKRVRERFDEEQVRRFRNQYVTNKVLEHEYQTRHIYGLPDRIDAEPEYEAKLRPRIKRPEPVFDPAEKKLKNKRRYKKLFKMNRGPRWDPRAKTPKMEGIDTIVVGASDTEGEAPGRKLEVKDIVGDAQQLLDDENESSKGSPRKTDGSRKPTTTTTTNTKTRPTESNKENNKTSTNRPNDFLSLKPSEDDESDLDLSEDEDPDEDIFEKARRKYNIVLDSDEDDL